MLGFLSFWLLSLSYFNYISAEIHGGTFLALAGRDSVIMALDSRFSSQQTGTMLIGEFKRPVIRVGSNTLIGCYGLESDAHLLVKKIQEKLSDFMDSEIQPEIVSHVVSKILYKSGLYCVPLIIGHSINGPYICSMDSIGASTITQGFASIGTANAGLLAICELLYQPNLSTEALIQLTQKCMKLSLQRDVLSGCKMRILILNKNEEILETFFHTDDS